MLSIPEPAAREASHLHRLIRDLGPRVHAARGGRGGRTGGGVRVAQHGAGDALQLSLLGRQLGLQLVGHQRAEGAAGPRGRRHGEEQHPERGRPRRGPALHGAAAGVEVGPPHEGGERPLSGLHLQLEGACLRVTTGQHRKVPVPDVVHLKEVDHEGVRIPRAVQSGHRGCQVLLLSARGGVPHLRRLTPSVRPSVEACKVHGAVVVQVGGPIPLHRHLELAHHRLAHAEAEAPHVPGAVGGQGEGGLHRRVGLLELLTRRLQDQAEEDQQHSENQAAKGWRN
mmetsp:Transcript_34429/g.82591  ORF Transcript_34429/g.82591 Transcript_34429/m.82591 type:complete len:283 (+) Transcript_34429:192-1040(+)